MKRSIMAKHAAHAPAPITRKGKSALAKHADAAKTAPAAKAASAAKAATTVKGK